MTFLDEIELRGKREGIREGKREGIREGKREGRATALLEQLAVRFGAVPDEVRARVMAASESMLVKWTPRILTAPTLEGVIGPGSTASTGSGGVAAPPPRLAATPRSTARKRPRAGAR